MAFLSLDVGGIWPSCCADAGATGGPSAVGLSEKHAAIIAPWIVETSHCTRRCRMVG